MPYTTMRKIEVVSKQAGGSVVRIRVTTPPVASKVPVKSSPGSPLRVEFALAGADVERFHTAVRGRGLVSTRPFVVGEFVLTPRAGGTAQRRASQAFFGEVAGPPGL